MGYCYGRSGRRLCDSCGEEGGRLRVCPHKVLTHSLHGARGYLPYCPAPSLCKACYAGKEEALHAGCGEPARKLNEEYEETERRLDSGAELVVAAWGDWHPAVPTGLSGVCFKGRAGVSYGLVPAAEYNSALAKSEMNVTPWENHP